MMLMFPRIKVIWKKRIRYCYINRGKQIQKLNLNVTSMRVWVTVDICCRRHLYNQGTGIIYLKRKKNTLPRGRGAGRRGGGCGEASLTRRFLFQFYLFYILKHPSKLKLKYVIFLFFLNFYGKHPWQFKGLVFLFLQVREAFLKI